MSTELETAGMASAGALKGAGSADGLSECRNCGAAMRGRFCHECGQLGQSFHRPIWSLLSEALGDFFSLDGRLMQTLPALMFRPGHITKRYIDGERARFVPPFRLYLLSSLLFFLTLFTFGERSGWFEPRVVGDGQEVRLGFDEDGGISLVTSTPDDVPSEDGEVSGQNEGGSQNLSAEDERPIVDGARVDRSEISKRIANLEGSEEDKAAVETWAYRLANIYENQPYFFSVIQEWAPRLALLLMPIMVLNLIILFPFRKKVYVYHHLISALHAQTWFFLLVTALFLLSAIGLSLFGWVLIIGVPIYTYRMLRVVYGAGRFLGLVRTFSLLFSMTISVVFLLVVLIGVGAIESDPASSVTSTPPRLSQN